MRLKQHCCRELPGFYRLLLKVATTRRMHPVFATDAFGKPSDRVFPGAVLRPASPIPGTTLTAEAHTQHSESLADATMTVCCRSPISHGQNAGTTLTSRELLKPSAGNLS
ncbi:MAG: hypothetical protein ACKO2L_10925 [Planctomycetaceae bacterium]